MAIKESQERLNWSCHTPNLLNEILTNPGLGILVRPVQAFAAILHDLATRASEINDPELNELMVRLTLYEVADPRLPGYDKGVVDQVRRDASIARQKKEAERHGTN